MNQKETVSIIIPVYNEELAVEKTIQEILQVIKSCSGFEFEVIAVDDASTDMSWEVMTKFSDRVLLLRHPENRGYGASLKTGIRHSKGEWILIIDADGTYSPFYIQDLLAHIQDYDMVIGARTGKKVKIPLLRRPAKWMLTKFANFLCGKKIPDLNSGLRVIRREIIDEYYHLLPSGFSFTATITLACLTQDYFVKFIPIDYFKREGKSTVRPIRDFFKIIYLIVIIIAYFNPLRVFFPLSVLLFLGAIGVYYYSYYKIGHIMDTTISILLTTSLQFLIFGLIAELLIKIRK